MVIRYMRPVALSIALIILASISYLLQHLWFYLAPVNFYS